MKTITLFSALVVMAIHASAITRTAIGNGGQGWSVASNWNPAGVPQSGDHVLIPDGVIISVKGDIYNSAMPKIIIQVYGTLDFDPSGKLNLDSNSTVELMLSTAYITSNGTSSELININGITKYKGSVDGPSFNGPMFSSRLTGSSPNGFYAGVLRIKLEKFAVLRQGDNNVLRWSTEEEVNASHFIVEKSSDGREWSPIIEKRAAGKKSNYSFTDREPFNGINYYRLMMVDHDQRFGYSSLVSIRFKEMEIAAAPNPARTHLTLSIPAGSTYLKMFSSQGVLVWEQTLHQTSRVMLDVSAYKKGIYTFLIADASGNPGYARVLLQ